MTNTAAATAEVTWVAIAVVRAMVLVMTAATAGAMVTTMAAMGLVSTVASVALAMRQQSV